MYCIIFLGELDSHLAPIGKEFLRNSKQDADWESEGANKSTNIKGIPGSSKRKQHYQKKVPSILQQLTLHFIHNF